MLVAEIGQNHLGRMDLARQMIDLSKENGAGMAKFQLFSAKKIFPTDSPVYQEAIDTEVTFDQAKMLFEYGLQTGIEVFFSVFDIERVQWCEDIGVKTYKLACRSSDDLELVRAVERTGKHVIQSVPYKGMFQGKHKECFALPRAKLLFCVAEYPAKIEWMPDFNNSYYVGFSDHTLGIEAAKLAIKNGAQIVEKHFAIDHEKGMDARWSMNASELKELSQC